MNKRIFDDIKQEPLITPINDLSIIPCLHDQCIECFGSGKKQDGSPCIHFISCNCPKCAPHY